MRCVTAVYCVTVMHDMVVVYCVTVMQGGIVLHCFIVMVVYPWYKTHLEWMVLLLCMTYYIYWFMAV